MEFHISDTRFAVRTLLGWYRAGRDAEALLPRLSTYLGHASPGATYWYLPPRPNCSPRPPAAWNRARDRKPR